MDVTEAITLGFILKKGSESEELGNAFTGRIRR
jgi:hypothetical protein